MSTIEQPSSTRRRIVRHMRFARLHVEPDGRLVEEQQPRPAADRDRELHLALLAGRELAVALSASAVDARQRECLLHRQRVAVVARRQRDVLARPAASAPA